jgi:membrane-associated phospholipid phosphatase
MIGLVSLVPFYIFIPAVLVSGRILHVPAIRLDELIPLQPAWVFVYGALYLFLIVIPVLVVRDEQHIRRTVSAYLFVWLSAYAIFVSYPTVASRPLELEGNGFGVWGLGLLYSADPPYNCFPSLHVAHSFVSAFSCLRLQRGLGVVSCAAAVLVGVSTLLTKQHYIVDVVAGAALACIAYVAFLRRAHPPEAASQDRQAVAALAVGLLGLAAAGVAGAWAFHQWGVVPLRNWRP